MLKLKEFMFMPVTRIDLSPGLVLNGDVALHIITITSSGAMLSCLVYIQLELKTMVPGVIMMLHNITNSFVKDW